MEKKQSKMGRPPLDPKKRVSERVTIRMTPADRNALEKEARKKDTTLSEILLKAWRDRDKGSK